MSEQKSDEQKNNAQKKNVFTHSFFLWVGISFTVILVTLLFLWYISASGVDDSQKKSDAIKTDEKKEQIREQSEKQISLPDKEVEAFQESDKETQPTPKEPIVEQPKQIGPRSVAFEKIAFSGEHYYTSAWLDYDKDGDGDIIGVNYNRQSYIYKNDGGSFSKVPIFNGYDANAIAVADFNKDGWSDFVLGNYNQQSVLFINNQDGTFTKKSALGNSPLQSIAVADFSGDTYPDVVVASSFRPLRLFVNDKQNGFSESVLIDKKIAFSAVASCDLNNDNAVDIIVGTDFQQNYLLVNNGDGTFAASPQFGEKQHTKAVLCGDFDNDGLHDVAVANNKQASNQDKNYVYWNKGDLSFIQSPTLGASKAFSFAAADFNLDGWLDIVIGNYDEQSAIWLNNKDGSFVAQEFFTIGYLKGLTVGDHNNDGLTDVALAKDTEGFEIYTAK